MQKQKPEDQLTLPLVIPDAEFKAVVKQHWNVTFARQQKISVYAKRIMALVIAQIQENDLALKPFYQMHIRDIVREASVDRNTAYKEVKKALKELSDQSWEFEDITRGKWTIRHLVDTTKILIEDGFEYGYDSGTITVVLNPSLKPFFIELGHYSTYLLHDYMKFKSWYSMRLYEILEAFKDTGIWYVPIDEYRKLMDCQTKYPLVKDLINKTLKEPAEELKETRMAFEYSPILSKTSGKGRPPIVALEFKLKHITQRKIPKEWLTNPKTAAIINALKEFKVTDANIVKYIKYFPGTELTKLIRDWQIKEASSERINDKQSYCNSVWVKLGKQFEEEHFKKSSAQ
jgi:plasmid replication initiation protein